MASVNTARPIQIWRYTGDPITWQDLVSPVDCNHIAMKNEGDAAIYFRCDLGDPYSEITIPPGGEEMITANAIQWPRFKHTQIFGHFRTAAGTGPMRIKYVR